MKPKYNPVTNPKHYTSHPSGIECIDVVRHFNFNIGNAIKYLWRCCLKGKHIEDLQKALFYIADEIESVSEGKIKVDYKFKETK